MGIKSILNKHARKELKLFLSIGSAKKIDENNNYEYYICKNSNFYVLNKNTKEVKLRKSSINKGTGYHIIAYNNKIRSLAIEVAKAFIPNPKNLPQVNHLVSKDHNDYLSLEWCTEQQNIQHAIETGLNKYERLTDIQKQQISKLHSFGISAYEVSNKLNIKYYPVLNHLKKSGKYKRYGVHKSLNYTEA